MFDPPEHRIYSLGRNDYWRQYTKVGLAAGGLWSIYATARIGLQVPFDLRLLIGSAESDPYMRTVVACLVGSLLAVALPALAGLIAGRIQPAGRCTPARR